MLLTKLMIFLTRLPVKRRDERKRIDRLIFSPSFFAVNRPHRKKRTTQRKMFTRSKSHQMGSLLNSIPHPIIGDKTPNFFVVGTNAFTCCPFMATSFLENGFCRHSCCSCMADFLAFWLHTHMNSEYGFQ